MMTQKDWETLCKETAVQMREHVARYTTPILKVLSNDHGELLGSGSYCEFSGRRFLITNEHIARKEQSSPLAHMFSGNDNVMRLIHKFQTQPHPIDVALSPIDESTWKLVDHNSLVIPAERFSEHSRVVEHELLFMAGYSGQRSKFNFGYLHSRGTPYTTQECPLPTDSAVNSKKHFAIHYNPEMSTNTDGSSSGLPLPPGLSGSLVWSTRRVEALQNGETWSPLNANVVGIIWGWPSGTSLVATKYDHMQLFKLANKQCPPPLSSKTS